METQGGAHDRPQRTGGAYIARKGYRPSRGAGRKGIAGGARSLPLYHTSIPIIVPYKALNHICYIFKLRMVHIYCHTTRIMEYIFHIPDLVPSPCPLRSPYPLTHPTHPFLDAASTSSSSGGSFATMGLPPLLLKAIARKGYRLPTPIQRKTIPLIMQGNPANPTPQPYVVIPHSHPHTPTPHTTHNNPYNP